MRFVGERQGPMRLLRYKHCLLDFLLILYGKNVHCGLIVITKTHMKHKASDLRSNLSRVCISRLLFAFCHMYPVTSGVQSYCL